MARPQNPSSSLYVGDLDNSVTEAILFDVFREIGPVLSIRVCRDATNKKSLGYAYVNFQNPLDAERAILTMNHTKIKGRMCRIMWCRRDPSLRKNGTGNIFIKNLAADIDNKALHDTFQAFGDILSCKVVTDEDEKSKGYGFVHFESDEAADQAVEKVNGMLLNGQQVYVGRFQRKDKKLQDLNETFTNLYVKHFDPSIDEGKLKEFFSQYGEIQSLSIQVSNDGEARGVAYVNYVGHEEAFVAVEESHDTAPEGIVVEGKKLVVSRHQKKSERDHNKKQHLKEKQQEFLKYTNLYVKNLDDTVTSETLKDAFNEFGKVMSSRVMTHPDTNVSKGFGFISFKDSEPAKIAMEQMNGRLVSGKPLYVTLAQKKDARKAQLETLYRNGRGMGMMGGGGSNMMGMGQMAPFPMGFGGGNFGMQGPRGFGGYGMGQGPMPMPGPGARPAPSRNPGPRPGGFPQPGMGMGGMPGMGMGGMPGMGMGGRPMGGKTGGSVPMSMQRPMGPPTQQPSLDVDPARLATMNEEAQKNLLGEKLFARIQINEPKHAAKVTGMLLEMDNAEILNLLDSPGLLQTKVTEAMAVLRQHMSQ